jgi:uncharacterized protein YicC (UPF0701 family)
MPALKNSFHKPDEKKKLRKKGQHNSSPSYKEFKISSMTGFGKSIYDDKDFTIECEVRSVNNRYLDISLKLPKDCEHLDQIVKKEISERFSRGKFDVTMTLRKRDTTPNQEFDNEYTKELFLKVRDLVSSIYMGSSNRSKKNVYQIEAFDKEILVALLPYILNTPAGLSLNGTVKRSQKVFPVETSKSVEVTLKKTLVNSLTMLSEMRAAEGAKLAKELFLKLKELIRLCQKIAVLTKNLEQQYYKILKKRIASLIEEKKDLDETRLYQELAIIADKTDITEERVRLDAHLSQLRDTMKVTPNGRKLEFIIQECNRELNTIASKGHSATIQGLVVEGKVILEKMREQVMNIE